VHLDRRNKSPRGGRLRGGGGRPLGRKGRESYLGLLSECWNGRNWKLRLVCRNRRWDCDNPSPTNPGLRSTTPSVVYPLRVAPLSTPSL